MINKILLQNTLDIPNNLALFKKEREPNHGTFAILTYHGEHWRPMELRSHLRLNAPRSTSASLWRSSSFSRGRDMWPRSPLAFVTQKRNHGSVSFTNLPGTSLV